MIELDKIVEILKNTDGVSDYEIFSKSNDERQLYYVGKNLETNRAVKTEKINVVVYADKDEKRGSSSFVVGVSDDEDTIKDKALDTVKRALAAGNKWYPITEKAKNINSSVSEKTDLNETALSIANAIFSQDNREEGQLNATEIFVGVTHNGFVNSKGVAHHYDSMKAEFETIPSWSGEEEVEVYNYTSLRELDSNKISSGISELLDCAKMRSEAVKADTLNIPKNIPIVIKSDVAAEIAMNIAGDANYSSHYQHINHFNVGDKIANEKFNLTLSGDGENKFGLGPIDSHGNILGEKKIIENGKVCSLWGDNRFGYYMNEEVTGSFNRAVVTAEGDDSYKSEKHILVYTFSAPQIDWELGYFGGEIRLATYFDGEKYIPITGFSVSGNIFESLSEVSFSTEQEVFMDARFSYSGPKYWIVPKMTVN